jgi:hypothetical protein
MRTSVRMYVIFDPAQPHIALDSADTLDAIATALAARTESGLAVYVNRDGLSRGLEDAEQRELDERLQQLHASPSRDGIGDK